MVPSKKEYKYLADRHTCSGDEADDECDDMLMNDTIWTLAPSKSNKWSNGLPLAHCHGKKRRVKGQRRPFTNTGASIRLRTKRSGFKKEKETRHRHYCRMKKFLLLVSLLKI